MTKTKALPATNGKVTGLVEAPLTRENTFKVSQSNGLIYIELPQSIELPMETLNQKTFICNDPGRSSQKIAKIARLAMTDGGTLQETKNGGKVYIIIQKIPSHLTEMPSQRLVSGASGFMGMQEAKGSAAKRLSFECADEKGESRSYAFGARAARLGGKVGLGESKTVGLDKRLMGGLTAFDVKSGLVKMAVTIPFDSPQQFLQEQAEAQNQIGSELVWSVRNSPCKVTIEQPLRVVPEDFFAERLSWLVETDELGNPYPCFQGMERLVFGLGFQTTNIIVVDEDGGFDPMLSVNLKTKNNENYGINRFYKGIAEKLSPRVNAEAPEFISLINDLYTQSLDHDYPIQVPGLVKPIPASELLGICNVQGDVFFKGLEALLGLKEDPDLVADNDGRPDITYLLTSTPRFTVVGGGGYLFGERLVQTLDNYEGFVSPLPDVASVIGLLLALVSGELG